MKRKNFIQLGLCGLTGLLFNQRGWSRMHDANKTSTILKDSAIQDDLKITRILCFNLTCHRPKIVGKNAVGGSHSNSAIERVVRLFTNKGIEAFGRCYSHPHILVSLLGKNPFDYYQADKIRSAQIE